MTAEMNAASTSGLESNKNRFLILLREWLCHITFSLDEIILLTRSEAGGDEIRLTSGGALDLPGRKKENPSAGQIFRVS